MCGVFSFVSSTVLLALPTVRPTVVNLGCVRSAKSSAAYTSFDWVAGIVSMPRDHVPIPVPYWAARCSWSVSLPDRSSREYDGLRLVRPRHQVSMVSVAMERPRTTVPTTKMDTMPKMLKDRYASERIFCVNTWLDSIR